MRERFFTPFTAHRVATEHLADVASIERQALRAFKRSAIETLGAPIAKPFKAECSERKTVANVQRCDAGNRAVASVRKQLKG